MRRRDHPGDVARGRTGPLRLARGLSVALGLAASLLALQDAAGADLEALRRAAAGGDAGALFQLADLYERGDGVEHDLATAAAYLSLAAERGHREAQYRLGLLHAGGLGVPEDRVEGYRWLILAAADDGEGTAGLLADSLRAALESGMAPEDLERARQLAAAFSPAPDPPAELPSPPGVGAAGPLLAEVEAYLPRTGCGEVQAVRDDEGVLRVLGYRVAGGGEVLPGDGGASNYFSRHGIDVSLVELAPPLCRALNVLAEHEARRDDGIALVLRNERSPEPRDTLEDGDYLLIEMPPAGEPRYVALDYFHEDIVLHLYPPDGGPVSGPIPPGQPLRLGDPAGGGKWWRIAPPFGRDLLVVFVSARPLYEGRRQEVENAEDYLAFLRRRLAGAAPGDEIRYNRVVVTTVPKGAAASVDPGGGI